MVTMMALVTSAISVISCCRRLWRSSHNGPGRTHAGFWCLSQFSGFRQLLDGEVGLNGSSNALITVDVVRAALSALPPCSRDLLHRRTASLPITHRH